jgi:nucleoside-diphosphate-sugar epimerase
VEIWAITGGSGFLGLHLSRHLLAEGERVRSLDLEPGIVRRVEEIRGDVRHPDAVRAVCRGADVLVHAAAALPSRGRDLRAVNVEGTATVLAAAAEAGVRRVVFVSSAVVYGLPSARLVTEETPPRPIEPYGASKLEAELVCREYGARGLEVVILRPQAFLGPERLGVFGILFAWIREGRRIYTVGAGTNRYQLLAVEDLVDAVVRSGREPVAGETLNLGAAQFGTVAEDLAALVRHAGSSSRITSVPAAPARALLRALAAVRLSPLSAWHYRSADRDCHIDCGRAGRLLGWQPRLSNVATLVGAYDWFAAQGEGAAVADGRTHRTPWNERALGLVRRLS